MTAVCVTAGMAGDGCWDVAPPVPGRVVVVVPHPDDEVLGLAMVMRWLVARGAPVELVACTDGEASHPRSAAIGPDELRTRRACERAAALHHLGLELPVQRLGRPDGRLDADVLGLADELVVRCRGAQAIVTPWEGDSHPDHRAAHAAGAAAAGALGAALWQVPIWGKVAPPAAWPGRVHRYALSPSGGRRKAAAVRCFTSQLQPLGPGGEDDGPVVHPHELAAMLDGTEVVLR